MRESTQIHNYIMNHSPLYVRILDNGNDSMNLMF